MFDTQHGKTPKVITLGGAALEVVGYMHAVHNSFDSTYAFTAEIHVNNVRLPVQHLRVDSQFIEADIGSTGNSITEVKRRLIDRVFDRLFEAWRGSDAACQILGEPGNLLNAGPWKYGSHIQAGMEPTKYPSKGYDLQLTFFGAVYGASVQTEPVPSFYLEKMIDHRFKDLFDYLCVDFSDSLLTTH